MRLYDPFALSLRPTTPLLFPCDPFALSLARQATRLSLNEMAREMQMKNDATVSMAIKRYALFLKANQEEQELTDPASEISNGI